MRNWYAIQTGYQEENRARHNLSKLGVQNLLPLIRMEKRRSHDGLLQAALFPLFSGYMFVRIDWARQSSIVLSAKGVKTFLAYWESQACATPIADEDMNELISRLGEYNGWDNVLLTSCPIKPKQFVPGMLVQILFGPFRGQTATVASAGGSRVKVLLDLLGATGAKEFQSGELSAAA